MRGQHDGKGAAFARLAFDPNTPAVLLDNALDDGQRRPGPLVIVNRLIGPVELVEDVGLILGGIPIPVSLTVSTRKPLSASSRTRICPPSAYI